MPRCSYHALPSSSRITQNIWRLNGIVLRLILQYVYHQRTEEYLVTDADPEKSYEYHGSDSYYEKEKQLLSCLLDDKTVSQ